MTYIASLDMHHISLIVSCLNVANGLFSYCDATDCARVNKAPKSGLSNCGAWLLEQTEIANHGTYKSYAIVT
eukprot:3252417-Pyramimonas_sp.AAC.1